MHILSSRNVEGSVRNIDFEILLARILLHKIYGLYICVKLFCTFKVHKFCINWKKRLLISFSYHALSSKECNLDVHCAKSVRIRIFLVGLFPHSDWIRRDTLYLVLYSVQMRQNRNQKNSKYGHFSYSAEILFTILRGVFKIQPNMKM